MTRKKNSLSNFRKQARNANKHTGRGLDLLDKSIRKNGWIGAMTAANDGEIFDGSARLDTVTEALPVDPIVIETDGKRPIIIKRTDIKKASDPKAVRLALEANRIQELDLNWDVDVLGEIAARKKELVEDLFGDNELKKMGVGLGEPEEAPEAQMDKADELLKKWKVKTGDLWQIGEHRLLCGDCTKAEDVDRVMGKDKANMIFSDPPYGVNYGHDQEELQKKSGGKFSKRRAKSIIENDDLSTKEIAKKIWSPAFANMYNAAEDDCSFYLTMCQGGDQMMMMMMMMSQNWLVKHELIWLKNAPVFSMGRLDYDYQHEPILFGWKKKHVFYGQGKFTKSIWEINKPTASIEHPTMKPVELVENALLNSSEKNQIVYDPFSGSGTTLIACERLGRKGRAIEIAPKYVAVALQRLADMGLKPKLIK